VLDGHVAMIVGNGMVIETGCQLGVQNDRRHGIASGHFMCPLEAKLGSQRLFPRAPRTTLNGFAPRYPNCGQDAATFETGPRVSRDRCARRSAHNRRHAA
jgi:hypothetical protein